MINNEKIISDILGMRDLYYNNIISFEDFKNYINGINIKNNLRLEKIYVLDSYEPFTNLKYKGYLKGRKKELIYSIYVNENI